MSKLENLTRRASEPAATESVTKPFRSMDSRTFASTTFSREWIVEGILVRNQAGVIGGPKKCLKTSLIVDLAISIGSGALFLNRFKVPACRRVAVFSGETDQATLQETALRVCASRKVDLSGCSVLWSPELPRLNDTSQLEALGSFLDEEKIKVAFIDPLYLCLLSGLKGASASNLYDVGPVLQAAARACLDAGATPVFAHHTRKTTTTKRDSQEPMDLDDLAFAGIAEFARQWILLSRRTPFVPERGGRHELRLSVGGSAGHNGSWDVNINEGRLLKNFTGRLWHVEVVGPEWESDDEDEDGPDSRQWPPEPRARRGPSRAR